MSSIKALMILNENPLEPSGGLGVHVKFLSDELRKKNVELTVLCVDYTTQEGGFYIVGDEVKEVERKDWKYEKNSYRLLKIFNTNDFCMAAGFINKVITDDLFIETALEILGNERFDVIHLHDSNLWRVAKNLRALFKAPIVMTCHLSFLLAHPKDPKNPYYLHDAQLEGMAMHGCNRLITVSDNYKENLKRAYFIDKGTTIYNGVNYEFLSKMEYDQELRKKYNKPLVVFVGRLVPTKGISLILKAVRQLPQFHFILIANISPTVEKINPLVKRLKRLKEKCKNFEWHNHLEQDKKWKLMKIADIGIMPSLHEPFGIVALEWMSLGVPLIVSNIDGLNEFCNNKNSTPINPLFLKGAIKSHERDVRILRNAVETAKQFTWERVSKETLKIYEEMSKMQ